MKLKTNALAAGGGALLLAVQAAAGAATQPPAPPPATQSSVATESAPIEEVLETIDNGYRFDAYIVRWHGVRIAVSDPLSAGHLGVGDDISFLTMHQNIKDLRLLMFMSTERDAKKLPTPNNPLASASAASAPALVEEVLSAEDGGYRFTAYVVRWHGKRVVVTSPLSATSHKIGDQFDMLVTHASVMDRQILGFNMVPPGSAESAAIAKPTADSGTVEEVLNSKIDGDRYTAYIVEWHGSHVGKGADDTAAPYQVGAVIPLTVSRAKLPIGKGGGLLNFTAGNPADSGAPKETANVAANMTTVSGTVERVLTAQTDDYHYRAYVVPWHGARVIVRDAFATTHYRVGDQVSFAVIHAASAGQPHLAFMMFDFACAAAASSCKPPGAARNTADPAQ